MDPLPNHNFPFPEPPWPNESEAEHVTLLKVSGANDWYVCCPCGFSNGPFQRQADAQMAWDDHLIYE